MYNNKQAREVFTFRHFAHKPYALFRVLGREVRVGVLSVATLLTAAPALAQSATTTASVTEEGSDTIRLSEAQVTAPPAASRMVAPAAVQVQVLTREDLQAAGVTTVNDALKLATGIDVRQRGSFGMQTDISIDGGTFDQIAFFLNGFPVSNPQTGHNAADFPVNVSDIRRIEILEGAAASLFGTQAFSGAVNIITADGPSPSPLPSSSPSLLSPDWQLQADLSAGSYGTLLTEARVAYAPVPTSLSVSYRRSDGAVENSDFEGARLFWQGSLSTRGAKLSAQAGLSANDFGANTFYSAAYPNQWEATRRIHVGLRTETEGAVRFVPEFSWLRNADHFQLIRGTSTGENYHRGDVFTGGFRAYAPWRIGALRANSFFASELRLEEIYSSNLGRPLPDDQTFSHYTRRDDRTILSLSAGQSLAWQRFTLEATLMAWRLTSARGALRFYPGLSLAYRPTSQLKFTASYARTLRLPTFTDLYYKSPTQEGNLGLRAEKNTSLRLGAELREGAFLLRAGGFWNRGTDMIDWVMFASDDIYHATSFRLDNLGASLAATADLRRLLGRQPLRQFSLSYTYIHQHRRDDAPIFKSNYALEYLRHKLVLRLHHDIISRLSAEWNLRVQRREGAYLLYRGGTSTGELHPYGTYAILDGGLRWTTPHYILSLDAQNLTAHHYYDLGNVRQPGFFILAGLHLWL